MMFNLIMIDDDEAILDNIAVSIDWQALGFQLIATFSNPLKAIEYIKSNKVDAIITDIKMPHLNGIELAKLIYKQFPNILVVFLSGYKDFEYAQKAVNYNVCAYLLKPINYREIITACKKLYSKLLGTNYNLNFINHNNLKAEKIISDLLAGKLQDKKILSNLLKEQGIYSDADDIFCSKITIKIDDLLNYLENVWIYGKDRLYGALNQLSVSKELFVIPIKYLFDTIEMVVIPKTENSNTFNIQLDDFINLITANCFELLNLSIHVSIDEISRNLLTLYNTEQTILSAKPLVSNIVSFISAGNAQIAAAACIELTNLFCNDFKYTRTITENIILSLSNQVGIKSLPLLGINSKEFQSIVNIDELTEYLLRITKSSSDYFSISLSHSNNIIESAIKYINENHMNSITLVDVADHVSFSSSYFSTFFKKQTGENFIDYLNTVRINKAQELLRTTTYKVNEICYKVGYNGTTYFYKKFKHQTGYSAKEFRNKYVK